MLMLELFIDVFIGDTDRDIVQYRRGLAGAARLAGVRLEAVLLVVAWLAAAWLTATRLEAVWLAAALLVEVRLTAPVVAWLAST